MSVYAVVPINALRAAKSRLRPLVDDADRQRLVLALGAHVLDTLRRSAVIDTVAVVSPDPIVLEWARTHGAQPIQQDSGDLLAGLELGRRAALDQQAASLLVVLGDLPLLDVRDIRQVLAELEMHEAPSAVVLAPDRAGTGTNLLAARPPDAVPFAFGVRSLPRHLALAHERGIHPVLYSSAGTSFDVDEPDDVHDVIRRKLWQPKDALRPHDGAERAWSA